MITFLRKNNNKKKNRNRNFVELGGQLGGNKKTRMISFLLETKNVYYRGIFFQGQK